MSFSNDEIGNNMNQNQNNSSTITDEPILQIANMLRNGLGIQQTQANLDKGQDGVTQKLSDDIHHNDTRKTKATSIVLIAK